MAKKDEKLLRPTAELIAADLADLGLPWPQIVIGEGLEDPAVLRLPVKAVIQLTLSDAPFRAGERVIEEQSYSLDIGYKAAVISAHNRAGIYFGSRSLVQLVASRTNLRVRPRSTDGPEGPSYNIPHGRIIDGPITRQRMLMLDVGRKAFPIDVLYDYLRLLGWYKMNELHLHLSDSAFDNKYAGFRVQCDTFPGLTSKDCFYTKRQLREFQDRAAAMGIIVTPEIDMPGHAACFTLFWPELAFPGSPGNLDVTNPKTIERMKQVLDEMVPLFDAPDFHIGTDEYGVHTHGKDEKLRVGEAFRRFINTMNAHVRSKSKNCRIWDGWEHSAGTTAIDPSVVVDMWWGVFDTNAYIKQGHKVINACQFTTYLTCGRPTYGVNNAFIYDRWRPNQFGHFNSPPGDPAVIGAKLHAWCGQGPTGWTMTEIADLIQPSLVVFSEKMWGRKASPDYKAFLERANPVKNVPGVSVFQRIAPCAAGLVVDYPEEVVLTAEKPLQPLPMEKAARADLEFPWTLTMEVKKNAVNGRGVILSSDLAEICDSYAHSQRQKAKNAADGKKLVNAKRTGFGVVRAAGNYGPTPAEAKMAAENSRVYGDPLPLDRWVKVAILGERRHTAVYIDGKLAGQEPQQMICPLRRYGSTEATASFRGAIRNLRVYDRALTPEEAER